MSEMSQAEFLGAQIRRAWEPPEEVVVPAPLVFSPDLQPEDYGVLLRLLLRDPGLPAGVQALAKEFQESGWKMGDTRLRGVMKRLRKAGHVQRERDGYDAQAGRPRWAFAVYRNPANNPEYVTSQASAFSQVRPTRGFSTDRRPERPSDALESNVFAGQADTLEFNVSGADALESDALESNVFAGQADTLEFNVSALSPPQTPPGGLVNPPTVPPRSTTPESVVAVGAGGDTMRIAQNYNPVTAEIAVSDAEVEAAGVFLANLPGRWACGAEDIAKYARLVAESAKRWGWPLGEELEARLTDMTGTSQKIRGHYPRVIPARLKRLPLYAAFKRGDVAPASGQGQRPPLEGACPNHPHRSAAQCLPCQADDDHDVPAERSARPVPDEAIAAARALIGSGKTRGRQGEKTPRSEARARRQSVAKRSAQAEAEAEENRLKAAALLRADATGALGSGVIPDQADRMETAQQR